MAKMFPDPNGYVHQQGRECVLSYTCAIIVIRSSMNILNGKKNVQHTKIAVVDTTLQAICSSRRDL